MRANALTVPAALLVCAIAGIAVGIGARNQIAKAIAMLAHLRGRTDDQLIAPRFDLLSQ